MDKSVWTYTIADKHGIMMTGVFYAVTDLGFRQYMASKGFQVLSTRKLIGNEAIMYNKVYNLRKRQSMIGCQYRSSRNRYLVPVLIGSIVILIMAIFYQWFN